MLPQTAAHTVVLCNTGCAREARIGQLKMLSRKEAAPHIGLVATIEVGVGKYRRQGT